MLEIQWRTWFWEDGWWGWWVLASRILECWANVLFLMLCCWTRNTALLLFDSSSRLLLTRACTWNPDILPHHFTASSSSSNGVLSWPKGVSTCNKGVVSWPQWTCLRTRQFWRLIITGKHSRWDVIVIRPWVLLLHLLGIRQWDGRLWDKQRSSGRN